VQVLVAGSQNVVSKLEFDALDRLVGSTSYAKTMALSDFGKATLDSATTTNASAQDRTTRFVYDAVGRQRFAVGADGSLSEKVYDALGRIKESRQFDLLLSNTTPRTEDALSARRAGRAVGDSITRGEKYSYDLAGRLLTTTDAAAFTETNEYNALGDKISFIDKNGAKCRYDYDRQGRLFDQFSPPVVVQLSNETAPTNRSLQTRLYHDASAVWLSGSKLRKRSTNGSRSTLTTVWGGRSPWSSRVGTTRPQAGSKRFRRRGGFSAVWQRPTTRWVTKSARSCARASTAINTSTRFTTTSAASCTTLTR
jgi:YD repeat-containing protein